MLEVDSPSAGKKSPARRVSTNKGSDAKTPSKRVSTKKGSDAMALTGFLPDAPIKEENGETKKVFPIFGDCVMFRLSKF